MGGRSSRVVVASCVLSLAAFTVGTAAPVAAADPPSCTYNNNTLPLVTGVEPGTKIDINCTGLPPLHPYLSVGTSLALAVDPAAAPLLKGQLVSAGAVNAALAALQEIDLQSAVTHFSDLSGNLDFTWTVPSTQPLDANTPCPPTKQQFNSGLIGCAMATIDMTSFAPVGAASLAYEYKGFSFLPPNPTMVATTNKATPGQRVLVGDAPGSTTYWWISTLAALQAALSGGSATPPTVTVTFAGRHHSVTTAENDVSVSPASYSNGVFTPPKLSGGFTVPAVQGGQKVTVSVSATLLGIPFANSVTTKIKVK